MNSGGEVNDAIRAVECRAKACRILQPADPAGNRTHRWIRRSGDGHDGVPVRDESAAQCGTDEATRASNGDSQRVQPGRAAASTASQKAPQSLALV